MKTGRLFLIAVLFASAVSSNAWDVAVAVGDKIQFLELSGDVVGNVTEGMKEVRSLTYNSELHKMYFSDNDRPDGSIFSMTVPKVEDLRVGNHTVDSYTVVKKQVHQVKGVVYDDMTGILYWTNGHGHSIMWIQVSSIDQPQSGQPLVKVEDQIPMGIAIDNCKRYLYWTNCGTRPSIERSLLDGSQREAIVYVDPALPYAVVVDQKTDRLYWVEELPGVQYKIESSDLNGKDRRIVVEGSDHQPFALAVAGGHVFWADHIHTSVWRQSLDHPTVEPVKLVTYRNSPLALVSAESGKWTHDGCNPVIQPVMKVIPATVTKAVTQPPVHASQMTNSSRCFNKGLYLPDQQYCDCLPGYSGELCEINECLDYCVHGSCHFSSQGKSCSCEEGYTGERCEVSVCYNYCVTGTCSIDLTGTPQCHCKAGFSGTRCEINFTQQQELRDSLQQVCHTYCSLWSQQAAQDEIQPFSVCSCPAPSGVDSVSQTSWLPDYTVMALLALCAVLMMVVAVLTKKVMVLRRRPRIKKRIIVNKTPNQPLTSRPTSPDNGQCEITIENCCNMNICETPCFEPDFRQPEASLSRSRKEGKEEKRGLLGHMELPPDDLY
ncbi:protein cueball [Macrosteles quadrilineatus]|uniref:protein cueball n=1 Tax=Macrosteles quadrilineatus TaxID=74068 RepID=UPI0023E0933D|nr:protein cueball [Macrosteles quadrilineatus]